MKEAAQRRVELQVGQVIGRVEVADHVVPLEDLMKHDAVEETAQADAQQDGRQPVHPSGGSSLFASRVRHVTPYLHRHVG